MIEVKNNIKETTKKKRELQQRNATGTKEITVALEQEEMMYLDGAYLSRVYQRNLRSLAMSQELL